MRVAQHRNEAERSLLERNWQQDVTMLSEGRRIDGDDIEFGAKLAEGANAQMLEASDEDNDAQGPTDMHTDDLSDDFEGSQEPAPLETRPH